MTSEAATITWRVGAERNPTWQHEYWIEGAPTLTTQGSRQVTWQPRRVELTFHWTQVNEWQLASMVMHGTTVEGQLGSIYPVSFSYPSVGSRPAWLNHLVDQLVAEIRSKTSPEVSS